MSLRCSFSRKLGISRIVIGRRSVRFSTGARSGARANMSILGTPPSTAAMSTTNGKTAKYKRLVLDWDGTMTMADTTSLIGIAAITACRESDNSMIDPGPLSASDLMDQCVEAYLRDYNAWKERGSRGPSSNEEMGDKGSALSNQNERLRSEIRRLDASRSIERRSFLRVRQSAILGICDDGIDESLAMKTQTRTLVLKEYLQKMRNAGATAVREGKVKIRDLEGLRRLLRWAEASGRSWTIVSVSWSRAFLTGAIIDAGLLEGGDSQSEQDVADRIWCNELLVPLPMDDQDNPNLVQTAGDKFRTLVQATGFSHGTGSLKDVVYVGDSTTDIGCLTSSGLGICMRNEDADLDRDGLAQVLKQLAIPCPSLDAPPSGDVTRTIDHVDTAATNVYWATSFGQILDKLE